MKVAWAIIDREFRRRVAHGSTWIDGMIYLGRPPMKQFEASFLRASYTTNRPTALSVRLYLDRHQGRIEPYPSPLGHWQE